MFLFVVRNSISTSITQHGYTFHHQIFLPFHKVLVYIPSTTIHNRSDCHRPAAYSLCVHIEKLYYEIFLSCQFRSKKDRNGWAEEGASLDGVLGKSVFIPEMQVLKSSIRLAQHVNTLL